MNSQDHRNKFRVELCLFVQRALLGAISSNILGICINIIDSNNVRLVVYVQGSLSEDQFEALDVACTEMMADFTPPIPSIVLEVIENAQESLSPPGFWIYLPYKET